MPAITPQQGGAAKRRPRIWMAFASRRKGPLTITLASPKPLQHNAPSRAAQWPPRRHRRKSLRAEMKQNASQRADQKYGMYTPDTAMVENIHIQIERYIEGLHTHTHTQTHTHSHRNTLQYLTEPQPPPPCMPYKTIYPRMQHSSKPT
jgi:hypothetical protein